MAPEAWNFIPQDALDFEKRRSVADEWALAQRSKTAEMWASEQRRIGQSMVEQFAPQLLPYLRAPFAGGDESGRGLGAEVAYAGPQPPPPGGGAGLGVQPPPSPGPAADLSPQGDYQQETPYQETPFNRSSYTPTRVPLPQEAPPEPQNPLERFSATVRQLQTQAGGTLQNIPGPAEWPAQALEGLQRVTSAVPAIAGAQARAQIARPTNPNLTPYEKQQAIREWAAGKSPMTITQAVNDVIQEQNAKNGTNVQLPTGALPLGVALELLMGGVTATGAGADLPTIGKILAKSVLPGTLAITPQLPNESPEVYQARTMLGTMTGLGMIPLEGAMGIRAAAKGRQVSGLEAPPSVGPYGKTVPGIPGVRGEIGIPGDISNPLQKPGYAGNIRLNRFKSPEIQQFVQDTVSADEVRAEMARRGVMGDALVRDIASGMGEDADKLIRTWQPGKAANAEQFLAVTMAYEKKVANAVAMSNVAGQSNNAQNILKVRQAMAEAQAAQMALHGYTAEAGRALRSAGQAANGLASNDQKVMESVIKTLGGRDLTEAEAMALSTLDKTNPEAVYGFMRNLQKPSMTDKLFWLWMQSVLSGPKTHIANTMSNLTSAVSAPIERGVSAITETGLAPIGGRPRERFFGEVPAEVAGMVSAIPDASRAFLQTMRKGYSPEDIVKMEMRSAAPIKGVAGTVLGMPGRALVAEDQFFKAIMQEGALRAEAYRTAAMEKLKGPEMAARIADLVSNPPDTLVQKASDIAHYRLFQAPFGSVGRKLVELRSAEVLGTQPLRFVLPFLQTPINLAKFGLERSPLGLLNPKLWRAVARASPEASDQIGRAMMGSVLAAGVGSLIASGQMDITAEPPVSAAERDRWYREGKQPFSIKIGNSWVSYQRLEPLNQTLAQIGATVSAVRSQDDKTAFEKGASAAASIVKNMVSQSYLTGLSSLMDAASDPARYGPQFIESMATGIMPFSSLGRTIVQATDATVRQPKGLAQKFQVQIPSLAQQLPAKLNAFGEASTRTNTPFERAVVPYQRSAAYQSPVDAELERLGMNVGFVGNSIGGVKLTADQQRQYQTLAGQMRRQAIEKTINSAEYRSTRVDAKKESLIRRASEEARSQAAEVMQRTDPGLRTSRRQVPAGVR